MTFNASHRPTKLDLEMLSYLSRMILQSLSSSWALSVESGTPRLPRITQIQPVFTKADTLKHLPTGETRPLVEQSTSDIYETVRRCLDETGTGGVGVSSQELAKLVCLPPLLTSVIYRPLFGIAEIRRNIVEACSGG